MTPVTEKILAFLDANRIPHQRLHHRPAGSAIEYQQTLNTRLSQQAKALFVRYTAGKKKYYAVISLPAQKKADLKAIASMLGADEMGLASREELLSVTGCAFGELPPIGSVFNVMLIVDRDLFDEEIIYFNAGDLTFSVTLKPRDLFFVEKPLIV